MDPVRQPVNPYSLNNQQSSPITKQVSPRSRFGDNSVRFWADFRPFQGGIYIRILSGWYHASIWWVFVSKVLSEFRKEWR